MFILQEKPSKFLLAMQRQRGSILNIGREFYSCNNSIYEALDRYESWGWIEVIKGKRDLHVKFTNKGKTIASAISMLLEY